MSADMEALWTALVTRDKSALVDLLRVDIPTPSNWRRNSQALDQEGYSAALGTGESGLQEISTT